MFLSQQQEKGEHVSQGPVWQPGTDKYSRLDRHLQNANSHFIEEQQVQQQVCISPICIKTSVSYLMCSFCLLMHQLIAGQQDEQLELVSGTIGVLKNMSERIGVELDEQAV